MATVPKSDRITIVTLASASAGPFDLTFRLFDDDGLAVFVNDLPRTDFTISSTYVDGFDDDAKITFTSNLGIADVVRIHGDLVPDRQDDYVDGPGLTPKLNNELGRVWSVLSELKRDTRRSVKAFQSVSPIAIEADKVLIGNPSGDGLEFGPTVDQISSAESFAGSAAASAFDAALSTSEITALRLNKVLNLQGRTALWNGTSIPQFGTSDGTDYPAEVGERIGMEVINRAWAGSHMRFDPTVSAFDLNNVKNLSMTEADRRAMRAIHGASSIYDDSFNAVTNGSEMTTEFRIRDQFISNPDISVVILDHNHNDRQSDEGALVAPNSAISLVVMGGSVTIDGQSFVTVSFTVSNGSLWAVGDGAAARVNGFTSLDHAYGRVVSVVGNVVTIAYDSTGISGSLTSGTLYMYDRSTVNGSWDFVIHAIKNASTRFSYLRSEAEIILANSYLRYTANQPVETGVSSVGLMIEKIADKWGLGYFDCANSMRIKPEDRLIAASDGTHPVDAGIRSYIAAHWCKFLTGNATQTVDPADFLQAGSAKFEFGQVARFSQFTQAFETSSRYLGNLSTVVEDAFAGDLSQWTTSGSLTPTIVNAPWNAGVKALKASVDASNNMGSIRKVISSQDGFSTSFDFYMSETSLGVIGTKSVSIFQVRTTNAFFLVQALIRPTTTALRLYYFEQPGVGQVLPDGGDFLANLQAGRKYRIKFFYQKGTATEAGRVSIYVGDDESSLKLVGKDIQFDDDLQTPIGNIYLGTSTTNAGVAADFYFGDFKYEQAPVVVEGEGDPMPEFIVADLPDAGGGKRIVFCSDETGGAVPVFTDGTDWRRITDRTVAS